MKPVVRPLSQSAPLQNSRDVFLEENGCTITSSRNHRANCKDEDLSECIIRQLDLHGQLHDDVEDGNGED